MTNREEFVAYLNIVAAGTLVGALVTEPLAWVVNVKIEAGSRILFELTSVAASVCMELIALAIIRWFLP